MKRYDIYRDYDGWAAEESDTGEFVRYDDIERLTKEHTAMLTALEVLIKLADDYRYDSDDWATEGVVSFFPALEAAYQKALAALEDKS